MIYTIGHSNHNIDYFIKLLKDNHIDTVADVRSTPYSRWNPQFNQDSLAKTLADASINYEPLGMYFGGKNINPSMYREATQTEKFIAGLNILNGLLDSYDYNVVLMCTEYDPMKCHRYLMIGKYLESAGMKVKNILRDGSIMIR